MNITIKEIKLKEKNKLEKLMQLYLHNICNWFMLDFNSDKCIYEYDLDSYFDNNKGYFIYSEESIVGFVLIDINDNEYEISEMFILNNYKKKHIGLNAVVKLFDLYRGNWVIKSLPSSDVAEVFWTNTVKKYTNNKYDILHTGKYNRAEITFNNRR